MFVPYSIACSVWKVPFFPVIPWHRTRVVLSTNTAGELSATLDAGAEEKRRAAAAARWWRTLCRAMAGYFGRKESS